MTFEQNVKAVLECLFSQSKEELIDIAVKQICDLVTEDCISREQALTAIQDKAKTIKNLDTVNGLCGAVAILYDLSSVADS